MNADGQLTPEEERVVAILQAAAAQGGPSAVVRARVDSIVALEQLWSASPDAVDSKAALADAWVRRHLRSRDERVHSSDPNDPPAVPGTDHPKDT